MSDRDLSLIWVISVMILVLAATHVSLVLSSTYTNYYFIYVSGIAACEPNPCFHGICKELSYNGHICNCTTGFGGYDCGTSKYKTTKI